MRLLEGRTFGLADGGSIERREALLGPYFRASDADPAA
jgi:hypothetical protein